MGKKYALAFPWEGKKSAWPEMTLTSSDSAESIIPFCMLHGITIIFPLGHGPSTFALWTTEVVSPCLQHQINKHSTTSQGVRIARILMTGTLSQWQLLDSIICHRQSIVHLLNKTSQTIPDVIVSYSVLTGCGFPCFAVDMVSSPF